MLLDDRGDEACGIALEQVCNGGGQGFAAGAGHGYVLGFRLGGHPFKSSASAVGRLPPANEATQRYGRPKNGRFMLGSGLMHFVDPSREVLAETLLAAGPDSATLCEGWRTAELAAHLYLREHRLTAQLGMAFKPLSKVSDEATRKLADKSRGTAGYSKLVKAFRAGPPRLSPLKLKSVDAAANLIEYFVHTEDVRRATTRWAPRALDEEYSNALWDDLIKRAALLYRGVDLGIVLVRPDGPRHVAKRASVSVAIVGEPGELLMHAHGRTQHALVTFEGQPDAVALLQSAEIGL